MCHIDTTIRDHAHAMGNQTQLDEARELITKQAVEVLLDSERVAVEGGFITLDQVSQHIADDSDFAEQETLAVQIIAANLYKDQAKVASGNALVRDVWDDAAYQLLYPHADWLLANEVLPF